MAATVRRLVGVYDADHTLRGEVAYWIGARPGRAHCALCDVTHGALREKREWQGCRDAMAVAFDTFHRDDQPDEVRDAAGGVAPVVVADTDDGMAMLLGPAELDGCHGSPEALVAAIDGAIAARGWTMEGT